MRPGSAETLPGRCTFRSIHSPKGCFGGGCSERSAFLAISSSKHFPSYGGSHRKGFFHGDRPKAVLFSKVVSH